MMLDLKPMRALISLKHMLIDFVIVIAIFGFGYFMNGSRR